MTLKCQKQE